MKINYLTGLTGFTWSLLRLRTTLSNLDPLSGKIKTIPQDDSVCAFPPEGHKDKRNPVNPV